MTNEREARIDTEIAKTHAALYYATMDAERIRKSREMYGQRSTYSEADLSAAQAKVNEAREAFEAADAQYEGWSRFFLVQNNNGHIHSSLHCSTCFFDTQYGWLTDMSGLTEADAVAAHGERLCSVCFPSAPVEWTNRYYVEERAARKAERDAERAAKAAAKAERAAKRAATVHYFSRYIRKADGAVIDSSTLRALKPLLKEMREMNSYGTGHGTHYVVDANTGEVVE